MKTRDIWASNEGRLEITAGGLWGEGQVSCLQFLQIICVIIADSSNIIMPKRTCAAAYCDSTTKLFQWPDLNSRPELHKAWTNWVKTDVINFKLTSNSRLCCKHFSQDCFTNLYRYATERENKWESFYIIITFLIIIALVAANNCVLLLSFFCFFL